MTRPGVFDHRPQHKSPTALEKWTPLPSLKLGGADEEPFGARPGRRRG